MKKEQSVSKRFVNDDIFFIEQDIFINKGVLYHFNYNKFNYNKNDIKSALVFVKSNEIIILPVMKVDKNCSFINESVDNKNSFLLTAKLESNGVLRIYDFPYCKYNISRYLITNAVYHIKQKTDTLPKHISIPLVMERGFRKIVGKDTDYEYSKIRGCLKTKEGEVIKTDRDETKTSLDGNIPVLHERMPLPPTDSGWLDDGFEELKSEMNKSNVNDEKIASDKSKISGSINILITEDENLIINMPLSVALNIIQKLMKNIK